MKRIIEYFDRAYIINLEDRPDRREEVKEEFQRVGIKVPDQRVRFYTAKRLTDRAFFSDVGIRGCFTSHRDILERASQDKLRNVLVFEDDVSFRDIDGTVIDRIA